MKGNNCIYSIQSPSGKIYIGKTIDFKKRREVYNTSAPKSQTKLWRSFCKYGVNKHTFCILIEGIDELELTKWEVYYIKMFDSFNSGLNCTLGGEGRRAPQSIEARFKMSESRKGMKLSDECKAKCVAKLRTAKHTMESRRRAVINNTRTVLNDYIVLALLEDIRVGMKDKELVSKYNLNRSTVANIRYGNSWKHLTKQARSER